MAASTAELLESTISTYINNMFKDVPPTEEEFLDNANLVREANKTLMPVSNEEFERILNHLKQSIVILMDTGVYINDVNNKHQSWLPAKRADFDFFFWNRYKRYLEEQKHWNPRVTTNLGKVSDEILDLCGDPSEERFSIRGLILGDVQSGKTSNYTAICNKAADTGYRIIIILAGIQENLRRQTQERMDSDCIGIASQYYLDPNIAQNKKSHPVGVGRYGTKKKIVAFTSVTKDFDSGVLQSNNLGIENVNCPVILVVKKNKKILDNLITWLSDNNTHNAADQIELPLMLIDDEADNASVDTSKPENEPSAINDCIRRLLKLFSKTTYLGITATPFANIFIDPEKDDDLFPADFIYALSAPTNYIGPDRIFGYNADFSNSLEEINQIDFERCFPPKHKKNYIVTELPIDLYEAAYYFLLVNAIRDYRGDRKQHRSMMVHISRFNNVQSQIADLLAIWLDQVRSDLRNYANLSDELAEQIETIHNLHMVWKKYDLKETSGLGWHELLKNYLYRAVAPIDVRMVNMKSGAAKLDYSNHESDGLRVIAVGGNSLSRGLTLEGLCVTYFYRNTNMYDTLMQMGRWFGYRSNYEDLVKIWMSRDAIDWYGQITLSVDELKDEITEMHNEHKTPREYGLKVRQDPGTLIVTALNKMRTASDVTIPVNVSGHLLETPRLKANVTILKENEKVFKDFINKMAFAGKRLCDFERTKGNYYWEEVDSNLIAQLLLAFETNPWHLDYNGKALSEYVSNMKWGKGWDVVLICRGEGSPYSSGIRCGSELMDINATEHRKILADDKMISVSGTNLRVGSGGCTKIGLTNQQIKDAEKAFRENSTKENVPDKAYLIKDRAPILMLHIIEAEYITQNKELPPYLFALGVGFPNNGETKTITYKANKTEMENNGEFFEYEEGVD